MSTYRDGGFVLRLNIFLLCKKSCQCLSAVLVNFYCMCWYYSLQSIFITCFIAFYVKVSFEDSYCIKMSVILLCTIYSIHKNISTRILKHIPERTFNGGCVNNIYEFMKWLSYNFVFCGDIILGGLCVGLPLGFHLLWNLSDLKALVIILKHTLRLHWMRWEQFLEEHLILSENQSIGCQFLSEKQ